MTINTQEHIDKLARVNGLVRISEMNSFDKLSYSGLKNVEELDLGTSKNVTDSNLFPDKLVSLKRISFTEARIVDIMPFICRSVEMHEIKIYELQAGVHFDEDTNAIDLFALNKEREKLPDARKITLFVSGKVYLRTKWAIKETDLGLIRLKRHDLFEWEPDFGC